MGPIYFISFVYGYPTESAGPIEKTTIPQRLGKTEKGTKAAKVILKREKKVKGLTLLSFEMWCVAAADKAWMSLQRERHTD